MRFATRVVLGMLLATAVYAGAPAQAQQQPSAPASSPDMQPPMQHMHGMHQKHVQEMKAQVDKMRATLEQMKANLAKIKKSGQVSQHDQLDADLWEAMVQHMESMVTMMSHGPGMGMGEMSCCAGMKDGKAGKCTHKDSNKPPDGPSN